MALRNRGLESAETCGYGAVGLNEAVRVRKTSAAGGLGFNPKSPDSNFNPTPETLSSAWQDLGLRIQEVPGYLEAHTLPLFLGAYFFR